MKKPEEDTLRPEYSRELLGKGVRGKHFEAFQKGSNIVALQEDVAKAFPTSEAVNEALRKLLPLIAEKHPITDVSNRASRKQAAVR